MSDVTINTRTRGARAAESEIDRLKGKINALSTSQGFKSAVQGVGMGIGMSAWGALKGAIGQAGDVMMDAVRAAVEEEAAVGRLTAVLSANVRGWDGSTDAIDRGIEARLRLGFTDDALRDSLAKLIPITRDIGEAQKVQAAAMDLARFKGIGLEEASLAIGKAMQGNKRMLKELGIAVSDAGTGYQTLAEIQKVVAGQAEQYAGKIAGKEAAAAARVGKAMADAGGQIVDWTDKVILEFDYLGYAIQHGDINVRHWAESVVAMQQAAKGTAAILAGDLYGATKLSGDTMGELNASTRAAASAMPEIAKELGDAADEADRAAKRLKDTATAYDTLKRSLADNSDLSLLPLRIAVAKDAVVAAQKDLAKARTTAERHEAQLRLAEAIADRDALILEIHSRTALADMYAAGEELGSALTTGLNSGKPGRVTVGVSAGRGTSSGAVAHALGGAYAAGDVIKVGELRPEYLIPAQAGYVSPNPPSRASSGDYVPVSIPIVIDGREVMRVVDQHLFYRRQRAPSA